MENKRNIFWITREFPIGNYNRSGMFIYRTIKQLSKHYPITVIRLYHITPPIFSFIRYFKSFPEIFKQWKKIPFSKPIKPPESDDFNVIFVKYLRPPRGRFSFLEGYFAFRAIDKKLKKLLKTGDNLLHANWIFPEGKAAELLAKKYNIPYIVTLRDAEIISLKLGSYNYKAAESILKNSKKVTSVANALFKECEVKDLSIKDDKKIITHNFYETDKFVVINKQDARKMLGIDDKDKMIFFAGGLDKVKNVDILINSFSELYQTFNDLKLFIAGIGYEEHSLRSLAKEKKVSDRVIFVGSLNTIDLVKYYNAADLLCLPSKNEGLPNVVVESLLCGTPVIASNVAEIPYLIKEGINGFLVQPNSISSLSDGITKGLTTTWNRKTIRESMYFLFPDNVLNEYKKLYEEFNFFIK
jgi:glycosyltransferase involved in cell wall biosynthesis